MIRTSITLEWTGTQTELDNAMEWLFQLEAARSLEYTFTVEPDPGFPAADGPPAVVIGLESER